MTPRKKPVKAEESGASSKCSQNSRNVFGSPLKTRTRAAIKRKEESRQDNSPVKKSTSKSPRDDGPSTSNQNQRPAKRPRITTDDEDAKEIFHVHDLPVEIMLSIFEYLGHRDKLVARVVCRCWQNMISNWKVFTNNVVYLVKSRTMASWTLSQSSTPWEKLRLEKFRLNEKGFGHFTLPSYLVHVVKSVEFSKSIVSWEGLKHNMLQFRALRELKIVQCKRRRKETLKTNKNLAISPSVRTRFRRKSQDTLFGVLGSVTSISLELRRISDMMFYIEQFNRHKITNLESISLKDIYEAGTLNSSITSEFMSSICKLLKGSAKALKCLRINISAPEIRNILFNAVTFLKDECVSGGLNLTTLDIARFGQIELANRDIQILKGLLTTQPNIRELRLPNPTSVLIVHCQELVKVIPKSVVKLAVSSDKYMMPDFFQYFDKLKDFQCDFDIRQFLLQPEVKYRRMRLFEGQGLFMNITTPLIVTSFPNITKLNLNGNSGEFPAMDDNVLQLIIKKLKKITCLILGSCSRISDFGVTGLKAEYCRKLYRSRALCLDSTLPIPSDVAVGLPLSELKGLSELTFAESTMITDVGIFYGFRLKELRYLNMRNNDEISDWGLDWMTKLNPDLHWLYYGCGRWVSSLGVKRIRSRLRRIEKRNCICVWPDDEYCSTDDSYSIESDED